MTTDNLHVFVVGVVFHQRFCPILSVRWDADSSHAMFLLHLVFSSYIYFDFEMETKVKKKKKSQPVGPYIKASLRQRNTRSPF